MHIRIKKQFNTISWSGGDTTELFIYPPDASYVKRNFLFRLSSATVRDEISSFTKLPGIKRKLLVLNGKIRLNHNGKEGKWLLPNYQEEFLGDWDTISEGKVVDFNVMTRGDAIGSIDSIQLQSFEKKNCMSVSAKQSPQKYFIFLYVWEGRVAIEVRDKKQIIREKELCFLEIGENSTVDEVVIENKSTREAQVIKTEVQIK